MCIFDPICSENQCDANHKNSEERDGEADIFEMPRSEEKVVGWRVLVGWVLCKHGRTIWQ